jgi:hypothetical protein
MAQMIESEHVPLKIDKEFLQIRFNLPSQHGYVGAADIDWLWEQMFTPGQNSCIKSGRCLRIAGPAWH